MHSRFACSLVLAALVLANSVRAQGFPTKPIRIITDDAGGGLDFTARMIAQGLAASMGQQVVVDNRGGGGGAIAIEAAAKAPADGYNLLVSGSTVWLLSLMRKNVAWNAARDFTPVSWTTKLPSLLVVHPSLPVADVHALIALAKAKPGQLNYSSGGVGSSNFMAAELFKSMAGVNIVHVAYKGAAPALYDLIGGQVQVMFPSAASLAPHLKSGKVKALAVTTAQPSALFPDIPTLAAAGVPGYEAITIQGLLAPSGTPAALISQLNQGVVRVLNRPDVKAKFLSVGAETVASSPEQFAETIKSETAKWGKVIREAGIGVD